MQTVASQVSPDDLPCTRNVAHRPSITPFPHTRTVAHRAPPFPSPVPRVSHLCAALVCAICVSHLCARQIPLRQSPLHHNGNTGVSTANSLYVEGKSAEGCLDACLSINLYTLASVDPVLWLLCIFTIMLEISNVYDTKFISNRKYHEPNWLQ